MEEVKKDTFGKIASELLQKEPEERSVIELQRSMNEKYYENLIKCAMRERENFTGSFFITVITKNEKLFPNTFRHYYFARHTCPTPDYDQSVFFYDRRDEEIRYIWTIPSQDACHYLINNALYVAPEERDSLNFVLQFKNGDLFKIAQHLNGELDQLQPQRIIA
jgi:hypothetical protein